MRYSSPYIDPTIEHVGLTKLRSLNGTVLSSLDHAIVIQDNNKPLAILMPYEQFLNMQRQLIDTLAEA